ncbi:MAG: biotin transporter BioY [marine benthic group bacterium]|nr:biotin transporter BioY [Candidatus Carthagonibacter metallireducens]MCL7974224.1 biotin transporter BioY [Gemmatimonadota bacterium]
MNSPVSQAPARAAVPVSAPARLGMRVVAVVAAAALTALAARVAVPLPGIPVPFTLQPVAVLLSGVLLGAAGGMSSQLLYLAVGMMGVPVFAAGGGAAYLLGPTGGYLLAFPLAAWVAGKVASRLPGAIGIAFGALLGLVIIHLGGLSWLAALSGREGAAAVGLAPFFVGDLLKIALVTLVGLGAGSWTHRARD